MMRLCYEGSDGTIIDFMSGPLAAQEPETLATSHWEYSTISGVNGLGKVKRFWKDTEESELRITVLAENADEFDSVMYQMHRTFDRDIRRMKPGKLWWNDFYREVFVVESGHESFDELMESIDKTILLISVYPFWIHESTYQYFANSGAVALLDYPMDYGFDYDRPEFIETIPNNCIDAANFEIRFYGPCVNPYVTIAGHTYRVYTTLDSGEYAVIDSKNKKIYQYGTTGEETNIFHLRDRESYIFEKIPEGLSTVLRPLSVGVDITIYDERGEPDWI